MDVMTAIRDRRAVRDYMPDAIDRWTVERLIEAAALAPSAMNRQPWSFAVILDRDRIADLGEQTKEWLISYHHQLHIAGFALQELQRPSFVPFHGAPALVLVLAEPADARAAEECCLAAENLMLAARAVNLGTCFIGFARPWLNLPEVKAELDLRETMEVVAPIVLGYPRAWPAPRGRRPAEIHWLDGKPALQLVPS
jgi:nitroreductase